MERDKEEVQEFMMERLDVWMETYEDSEHEEDIQEYNKWESIKAKIFSDTTLNKQDAVHLDERLQHEVRYKMENLLGWDGNIILGIDVLSIYADAWGIYCKPALTNV